VKLAIPRIGKDATGKDYPPMQLATDASQYAGGAVLLKDSFASRARHSPRNREIGAQRRENCGH
jgi:hypothetical protein